MHRSIGSPQRLRTPAVGTPGLATQVPLGPLTTVPRAAEPDSGIDVRGKVVPEGDFRITALGYEGCGKTTYIGMLYFLLVCGKLPGYRFAWSDSLRDLEEIRAQLHRPLEQGGPAFPPRTSRDKTIFLHLGLRRWEDDRYVDVYFPEFSGEDVGQVWTTGQFPENLAFMADMKGYIVFLDATALGMANIGKTQLLFESLLSLKKTKLLEDPVAVVISKWDTVGDSVSPDQFVKDRLGGLAEWFEGHLAHYRMFGVSAVGAVRHLAGRDGRPVKGPSGEPLTVPAPEPAAETDGPMFRYRPKNVSRPLVWLLSELTPAEEAT
jgi:hypothetical protein